MKNNLTSDELNTIRRRPQRTKWYLAHHRPFTWANLSITETPVTYPVSAIRFTGTSTGVTAGMTAWIGNNNGSNLGIVRVRRTPNGNLLPIAESGSGLINWKDATTISIKDQFLPWPRHPRYDTDASAWRMDYEQAYTQDNYNNLVQVNIGTPIVGFLDNGSFSASFLSDRSLSWDASVGITAWYWPNGSVSLDPGTTASPNIVTFTGSSPNGSYFRNEMFTSNGASSVGRRLIFLFDDESQLPQVSFGEVQGGYINGGYRATITAYGGTAQTIQENSEIIIFEQSSYNGIASSIGGNDPINKNIVFRGWVVQGTLQKNPFTNSATFEAQTIDGILNKHHSYDVFMNQASPVPSASHWVSSERLTMDRVALTMLQYRSTAGELVDFNPASGLGITNTILFQSLPRGMFWEQLRSNYNDRGMLGMISSDMQSNLFAFADAEISGASAALPSFSAINSDLMGTVQIDYQPFERNAQVQLYAVASDVPLGAESPGNVAGYYGGVVEVSRGLTVDTQDTLITWSGNQRAKFNKRFPRVTVPFSGNYKIDPVPQQLLKLSMKPSQNALGIEWSGKNFYPQSIRLMYDSARGYANSELEVTEVVNGIGGSSITFPTVEDIIPIPTPTPAPNPDPVSPGEGSGFGTVYVSSNNTLGRTRNFGAASPSWSDIASSVSGNYEDFILDPWNPAQNGYLLTSDGVYKSTDLDNSSPTWTNVLSQSEMSSRTGVVSGEFVHLEGSINVQDYVAVFFRAGKGTSFISWIAYTYNAGDTWSIRQIVDVGNRSEGMTATVVPHLINGGIRIYVFHAIFARRSDDGGNTWVPLTAPGTFAPVSCHAPYNDNENGNVIYVTGAISGPDGAWESTDSGASWTRIINDFGGVGTQRWGIESYTQDRQLMYAIDNGNSPNRLYTTENAFSSKTQSPMNGIQSSSFTILSTGGFPYNGSQFYLVTNEGIYSSLDRGVNWTSKIGDWAFGFDRFDSVIVPLWTE